MRFSLMLRVYALCEGLPTPHTVLTAGLPAQRAGSARSGDLR